jgi:hypothetical protein
LGGKNDGQVTFENLKNVVQLKSKRGWFARGCFSVPEMQPRTATTPVMVSVFVSQLFSVLQFRCAIVPPDSSSTKLF